MEYKTIKEYKFYIPGKVKAKQSVKFAKNGDYIRKYTPKDIVEYANWVKQNFYLSYPDFLPGELFGCAVSVEINVYFAVPKSFSKIKRQKALAGEIRPTARPDWDNISKNICDALNGLAYPDDKSIVDGSVHKYYAEDDYVDVIIKGKNQ